MTKQNDFRIQYPLWQIAFIMFLFLMSTTKYGMDNYNPYKNYVFIALLLVLVILLVVFMYKVIHYNRNHHKQKLSLWQVRPYEFLDQDEGMEWVTKRATQKVYTFFVWALPILAGIFFTLPPKSLFLAAAIPLLEIALVVPLGIIRGLSPFWVMLLGFTGNMLTVILLILGFQRVKEYFAKRKGKPSLTESKRSQGAKKLWHNYGLPGLALLGPILIGTHIAAFIGMSLGAEKGWTMLWLTISIALWTLILEYLPCLALIYFCKMPISYP